MNIGNTHIDGGVMVASVLVISALLAIYMLRRRPQPPIEHPSTRALRLVKEQWRVVPKGVLYFVPDDEDKVVRVESMTAHQRANHASGWLIRGRDGYIEMALVAKDQNPWSVRGESFRTAT